MTQSRRAAMKAIGVVGAGAALPGTVLAVGEHEDDERHEKKKPVDDELGAVRVAHFSPDAPNVDVYVDDQQVLSDVAYGDVSPYLEVAPGTYTVTITAAGDPETVALEEEVTVDAAYYTAAAIGELGGGDGDGDEYSDGKDEYSDDKPDHEPEDEPDGTFQLLVLVDATPDDVEAGTAQVRVVHASPDAPAVDIVEAESGAAVFEDVAFSEPSGYVPVEPGPLTLEIYPAGARDEPVAVLELELEEGTPYTGYAIGYLEPEPEEEPFEVAVTIDGVDAPESS
ncbi:DUF4397 domain-containing protein [Natrarchaeobius chitinivorans]|uniref:DUF4397 domain-containing protein n=1 Tax=Natrarchaeobius chitinivorans TaxID=1679083 RepID=A0A3N6MEI0_NATCH|nr:DUF4397 domain-containing protein [Natrarchaeobius chitinivorans]RQG92256.1 DUF4397 domain-containing protein [Natrarchaeobius chitinivorans]